MQESSSTVLGKNFFCFSVMSLFLPIFIPLFHFLSLSHFLSSLSIFLTLASPIRWTYRQLFYSDKPRSTLFFRHVRSAVLTHRQGRMQPRAPYF